MAETGHPSELPDDRLLGDCEQRLQRRSGPGGQHRNKVETAVILTHRPSGIQAEANERRSQQENRTVAIKRLRVNIALQLRTPRGERDIPSARWQARAAAGKLRVSVQHADFAPLLAEALDVIAFHQFDVVTAAKQLGVSTSQLVKFLKREPRALQQINHARESAGLHALK